MRILCMMKIQHFYSFLGHVLISNYQALYICHACSFKVVAFELLPWRIKGKATASLPFYYPAGKQFAHFLLRNKQFTQAVFNPFLINGL